MLSNCDIRKVMAVVIMVVVVVVAITEMFPSFSFVSLIHLFCHFWGKECLQRLQNGRKNMQDVNVMWFSCKTFKIKNKNQEVSKLLSASSIVQFLHITSLITLWAVHECVNKYVRVSELQTQADSHTQIKPPPRHNYRRLKFHNNPLRGKQREREKVRIRRTLTLTDTQREAG